MEPDLGKVVTVVIDDERSISSIFVQRAGQVATHQNNRLHAKAC